MDLIAKLLLVALNRSTSGHELEVAFAKLRQTLKEVDPDGHMLVERLKTPSVSDEDMQMVFNKGRELGRTENAVAVVPKKPLSKPPGGVSRSGHIHGFEDSDCISGSDFYKNYSWSAIAEHCADNMHRVPDKHHEFLADMADKLEYATISGRQAKYLINLFNQYLGGKI
jgi:hypothetical protein